MKAASSTTSVHIWPKKRPRRELNSGPLVYKTSALPLCYEAGAAHDSRIRLFVIYAYIVTFTYCPLSVSWRNGSASDFGSEGCRFEPCRDRFLSLFFFFF
ncbi:hypothetical protein TRVL_09716 [Trypanosoma vivax]|nr:hypothetical protein TRVL_09716 [Trypanosoma vivax]